jgi:hypothetical protein
MNDCAIQNVLGAQQAAQQTQVEMAIAKKQLSAMKQQGQAAVELIEAAANLSKSINSGAQFDAQA